MSNSSAITTHVVTNSQVTVSTTKTYRWSFLPRLTRASAHTQVIIRDLAAFHFRLISLASRPVDDSRGDLQFMFIRHAPPPAAEKKIHTVNSRPRSQRRGSSDRCPSFGFDRVKRYERISTPAQKLRGLWSIFAFWFKIFLVRLGWEATLLRFARAVLWFIYLIWAINHKRYTEWRYGVLVLWRYTNDGLVIDKQMT